MYTWYQAIEMASNGTPMHSCESEYYMERTQSHVGLFNKCGSKYIGIAIVSDSFINQTFVPYVKKVKLTDDEKVILRNLPEEYKWIARDGYDNNICVFSEKPHKTLGVLGQWDCEDYEYELLAPFNHLFPQIKWEDAEPTLISDLLKE